MSRVDDVIWNFIYNNGCSGLNEDSKKLLSDAVRYGFEQGESFGRYAKYAEKVEAEYLIQPENDRTWREKLEEIEGHLSPTNYECQLLAMIAEILLVRKNGG